MRTIIFNSPPEKFKVYDYYDGKKRIDLRKNIRSTSDGYEADVYSVVITSTPGVEERIAKSPEKWENYIISADLDAERKTIRTLRESECFPVINRGQMWFDALSEEQKSDLNDWYRAWLDAPESMVIPDKPGWL